MVTNSTVKSCTENSCRSLPAGEPMPKIIQLLTAILLLVLACVAHAQDLTASVDRNELAINETFTLTLRYSGSQSGGQPDFNLLEQDFEVLSRQQSNQYRVFNGRAESFVEWTIVLAPLKEGKLFVPSLHLHGQVSDAIPITVNQAGESPSGNNRQAFLEVELDKDKLFVQEQLLIKVRLYTTVGLHDIATDPLQIPGAHVEKVDEQRYERRIQGVGHAVYELTYAVFPESSGELQIPALNYVAVTGRRDPFSLFNRNAQRIRLRSEAKTVKVEPKPDSYSGSHWLPAASLGLVQSWSKDPEEFKVGEPITRIITLRAEGLRAAQLPPLPTLDIEGLKMYPDQAQKEDQTGPNGITGTRVETTAIVATKPGQYQLPPITITWWDSKTGQQRATQLPAFRFNVSGSAVAQTTQPTGVGNEAIPGTVPTLNKDHFWRNLAIAALASHLFWLIYLFHQRRKTSTLNLKRDERNQNLESLAKELQQAIASGDAHILNRSLERWLAARYPEVEPDLEELKKLRELVSAALYQQPPRPLSIGQVKLLVERIAGKEELKVDKNSDRTLPDLFA